MLLRRVAIGDQRLQPVLIPRRRDRLSFMRFLGLGLEGRVPDAKTVWLYREQLTLSIASHLPDGNHLFRAEH